MVTTPHPSSLALAERLGIHAAVVTVAQRNALSPHLVEIVLQNASALAGEPGNDIMLLVDAASAPQARRRYSVRTRNEAANTLTLWITTGHDGPGAQWAQRVGVGDEVDVVGPRGKITLDPLADWYLFIGDLSGLAAFYRMAESIETPGQAIFIVEVDDMADAVTASFSPELGITGIFVERQGREHHDPTGLLRGLSAFEFPPHEGHAYVFAEFAVTKAVSVALQDRGLTSEQISTKAFYRTGRPNAVNGEPERD